MAATVAFALLASGAGGAAQQLDTISPVRRALEGLHRDATVRLAVRGRSRLTGNIVRIGGDSVYVQGFDWPTGIPLAKVDSVWERVGDHNPRIKTGFAAGAMVGAVLVGALFGQLCSFGERQHCGATMLAGAVGGGILFGSIGAGIGSAGAPPPRWVRRYP